jgi:hypothetical protein
MGAITSRPARASYINQPPETTVKAKSLKLCNGSGGACGSVVRRAVNVIGWIVPSAILALIPKCPMCLAAYIALWTGIGLSISAAIYLRVTVLVLCVGVILFLAARSARLLIYKLDRHEQIIGRSAPC